MNIATDETDLSRGVEKNGQELGLENELKMLACILMEGWVREHELHRITGMSKHTVGQVSRRLAKKRQIYRERINGNAGYFLRLLAAGAERVNGKSGKDIGIPASWPHQALAIQTLHYLAGKLNCKFETESSMRRSMQSGKLPDGRLLSGGAQYHFEQERTRKTGPAMRKQAETIATLAASGTTCFVAYPYPAAICGGIDHEIRQTNAIRHKWGNKAAPNIKFVRCHFDSLIAYQNMHVSQFEIIDLPAGASRQAYSANQEREFNWDVRELSEYGKPRRIDAILRFGGNIVHKCTFVEGATYEDPHLVECDYFEQRVIAENLHQTFNDFVQEQKRRIEQQIENERRMYAYQDID